MPASIGRWLLYAHLHSQNHWLLIKFLLHCRYADQAITGNQATTKSFHLLLDLMTFFDQYHARDLDRALKVNRMCRCWNVVVYYIVIWAQLGYLNQNCFTNNIFLQNLTNRFSWKLFRASWVQYRLCDLRLTSNHYLIYVVIMIIFISFVAQLHSKELKAFYKDNIKP